MKKLQLFFSFFLVSCGLYIFTSGCQQKPISMGTIDKIIVLTDSTLWEHIEEDTRAALEQEIFTPQPEKIFNVDLKDPSLVGRLGRFPHLLFIGTLEGEGASKKILENWVRPELRAKIEADSVFIFQKQDAKARNQLLVVLASKDLATLKKHLQQDKNVIFNLFNDHTANVVSHNMYRVNEKKELEKQLLEKHGWSVRVQHDFFVAMDSTDARFVWLRRMIPQREFFVYWEPVDDPSLLSKEWMVENRARLGLEFYDGDYIYEDETIKVVEKIVDFQGRYAIRLDGVWQNEKHMTGGPFRSFGFYNEDDGRLYLIDCSIVAPGEKKWPYMRQVEAMAFTFKTANSQKSGE